MDEWPRQRAEATATAIAGRIGTAPLGIRRGWPALPWRAPVATWLALEIERRAPFPWIAVAFGIGILLFFQAEGRPALWAPVAGLSLAVAAAITLRRHLPAFAAAVACAALFAGFTAGMLRLDGVAAPILDQLVIGKLEGFVETIEERREGARLVIRVHDIAGLEAERRPTRVRVTLRRLGALQPGQFVAATARLLPPPQAAWPGGYDFAREAYFRGIGAVGSLVGTIEIKAPPIPPGWRSEIAAGIDGARNAMTKRIADTVGGPAGAVAAALITGKRGLIDERTNEVLRGAGIYHIVSISGLHMVLAAGGFFWIARAVLAAVPTAALLWPVKKIAAVVGMIGATVYCVFAGAELATERSLIMTLVMFGAILADRPALSLRNLAIAALIVLSREPETLLGPSFQMSFGAVAALVTVAPLLTRARIGIPPTGNLSRALGWVRSALIGLAATTFVAGLATAPFSAYHFQTANPLGLLGNALALPLVGIVVMPSALAGVLAYPFGLDRPIWWLMGAAVRSVLDISAWVSALDGATVVVPAFGPGALALFGLALLVLTLLTTPLRFLGLAALPAALAVAGQQPRPDLFVDRDGSGAAVRGADGRLVLLGRVPAFVAEQWLKADGDGRQASDPNLRAGARCDPVGCVAMAAGRRPIALVLDRRAFEEDCRRAEVVISRLPAPETCRAPHRFDRAYLAGNGAITVRWTAGNVSIEASRRPDDPRPWLGRGPKSKPPGPPPTPTGELPTAPQGEPGDDPREDPRP